MQKEWLRIHKWASSIVSEWEAVLASYSVHVHWETSCWVLGILTVVAAPVSGTCVGSLPW